MTRMMRITVRQLLSYNVSTVNLSACNVLAYNVFAVENEDEEEDGEL